MMTPKKDMCLAESSDDKFDLRIFSFQEGAFNPTSDSIL